MTTRWTRGAALAAALTGGAHAADQTMSFTAVQDTSIFYGTIGSENLADGSGDFIWVSVTAEGLVRRMLVKFDVSALPRGAVVRQVTLTLYESRARDEHAVTLHRLLASWGEGTSNAGGAGNGAPAAPGDATWVNRFQPGQPWTTPGGDFDPVASATRVVGLPNTTYSWGGEPYVSGDPVPRIVRDVQGWVDAPGSNHGWIFIGVEAGLQNAKRFESRNNATSVNRPRLTVVYGPPDPAGQNADVPVPPWALGALAALLVGARIVRTAHERRGDKG
jgi:hypothetical protein